MRCSTGAATSLQLLVLNASLALCNGCGSQLLAGQSAGVLDPLAQAYPQLQQHKPWLTSMLRCRDPAKAVKSLTAGGMVDGSPASVATFLHEHQAALDPAQLGEFLGGHEDLPVSTHLVEAATLGVEETMPQLAPLT